MLILYLLVLYLSHTKENKNFVCHLQLNSLFFGV